MFIVGAGVDGGDDVVKLHWGYFVERWVRRRTAENVVIFFFFFFFFFFNLQNSQRTFHNFQKLQAILEISW